MFLRLEGRRFKGFHLLWDWLLDAGGNGPTNGKRNGPTKYINEWKAKYVNEWETKYVNEWKTNKRINE